MRDVIPPPPPLGCYDPVKFKARFPHWWPDETPIEAIDFVRVRRPRNLLEGKPHEVMVDFIYKRGLAPKDPLADPGYDHRLP